MPDSQPVAWAEQLRDTLAIPLGLELADVALLDAAAIRARSRGAVTNAETYELDNGRPVLPPVAGGLFCPAVFGPIGEAPVHPKLDPRADRFGHIELPEPVAHPLIEGAQIEALLVPPPAMRLFFVLDGQIADSDLNSLYRKVILRCARFSRLRELQAPSLILEQDRAQVQASVRALFYSWHGAELTQGGRALRGLAESLALAETPEAVTAYLLALGLNATVRPRPPRRPAHAADLAVDISDALEDGVALQIRDVFFDQQLAQKAPYYSHGGPWLVLECMHVASQARLTLGIEQDDAPRRDSGVGSGHFLLACRNQSSRRALFDLLSPVLEFGDTRSVSPPGPRAALIGGATLLSGGDPEPWARAKLSVRLDSDLGELLFSYDLATRRASLRQKASLEGPALGRIFAKALLW